MFPLEKPLIYLRSLLHKRRNKVFSEELDNYPFSPRWDVEQMVQRLIDYLPDVIKEFNETCNRVSNL